MQENIIAVSLVHMNSLKSLRDFLAADTNETEVYTTDQKKRYYRQKLGLYSRQNDCFDFIHLVQSWEDIVGPMLASNTIPLKIQNGQLIVLTKHAIFSQELGFMTPIILKKITQRFPKFKNQAKKIKFVTSEKYFNVPIEKKSPTPKHSNIQHAFSPEYQRKKILANKAFSEIEDEELKDLLISLYLQG